MKDVSFSLGTCHICGKARTVDDGPYGNIAYLYCKSCVEKEIRMKDGYYWVKVMVDDAWTVGLRTTVSNLPEGHYWLIVGQQEELYDDEMEHIGARIKGQPDESSTALEEVL